MFLVIFGCYGVLNTIIELHYDQNPRAILDSSNENVIVKII